MEFKATFRTKYTELKQLWGSQKELIKCSVQNEGINVEDIEYEDIFGNVHAQHHAIKVYMRILKKRLQLIENQENILN